MTRTITLACIMILAASAAALAQGVPAPSTPRLMVDPTGQLVDDTHPLPTKTTITGVTLTASGSIQTTEVPLATPTITDMICWSTPQVITGPASRAYVLFQNKAATESFFVKEGITATPGLGIEVQAGDSVLRPWGSSVKCAVVSTNSLNIVVEHGVQP